MSTATTADERSRLAATAAPVGLFLMDASGDVTFVNGRLCEILETTEASVTSAGFVNSLHPDDRGDAAEWIAAQLAGGDGGHRDHRVRRADGTIRWVRIWASPALDHAGDGGGITGAIEDITAIRAADEATNALDAKLARAQRLESLGTLAGGIAHDFNNLLVGILGNLTLAQMDVEAGSETAEALSDVRNAAERASELTKQLLAWAGRGTVVAQPVDVNALVEEAHALLRSTLAPQVRVTLDLTRPLQRVTADATQLGQVAMHVLTNAVEALGEAGGEVVVRTGTMELDAARKAALAVDGGIGTGTHAFLEVRDSGCGMDATTLGRMFDPFFTTKRKGRGHGLAITVGTVRTHRAGLEVTSTPGVGTTIRVLLPMAARAATAATVATAATTATTAVGTAAPSARRTVAASAGRAAAPVEAKGTILIVDDDASMREVSRRVLTRKGFEVLEAESGARAIELLTEAHGRVRCALLDLTMPGMDGYETFRRMREVDPQLAVVVATGYGEDALRGRFGGGRAVGFLQKPFELSTLLRTVQAAIER